MKGWKTKLSESKPFDRFTFLFLGLLCIATGALSLLAGRTHYRNVWGAPVFAPFAIFVGLLCLLGALKTWNKKP
jgi:hypothetical protein